MKAHLMHPDADFDAAQSPGPREADLVQDLELSTLFGAMAGGDKWLADVVARAVLSGLTDVATIRYRQDVLRDCLAHEDIVRGIYRLAVETLDAERKSYFGGIFMRSPSSILYRSVEVLQMLVGILHRLRAVADEYGSGFESAGFRTMFAMLQRELDDEYFQTIQSHLKQLKFAGGVLVSAELGDGNRGVRYVLRKENPVEGGWMERLFGAKHLAYSYQVPNRDEAGALALGQLRDRGINLVADAVAQSADHVMSFFNMLRTELAFYVGALNLHRRLSELEEPTCFPEPVPAGERRHAATDLHDVCLALRLGRQVVGSDVRGDGKDLTIITGPNTGGKSTFLRSIGVGQLMMQCGMFVPARTFSANVCERVFTHYKREEDVEMKSGKFDEELSRMSGIVESLVPESLILFNESFASTNEREGSEIARQIVTALLDRRVKVFFVTHQYELARGFYEGDRRDVLFLRAERLPDGTRTFKITEAKPLETSYGEDLYREIFVEDGDARPRPPPVCRVRG